MDLESWRRPPAMLITRMATLVAVGVTTGLLLSGLPNIELVTAVCFASGFLLGAAAGMVSASLTELLFAGFHPLGSSFGPILLAQVIGMAMAAFFGAIARNSLRNLRSGIRYAVIVVGFGIISTLLFDFLTNLAYPLMAGFSVSQTAISLLAGIPFAAIHLASNTAVFIIIVCPLLPRLEKTLRLP